MKRGVSSDRGRKRDDLVFVRYERLSAFGNGANRLERQTLGLEAVHGVDDKGRLPIYGAWPIGA